MTRNLYFAHPKHPYCNAGCLNANLCQLEVNKILSIKKKTKDFFTNNDNLKMVLWN